MFWFRFCQGFLCLFLVLCGSAVKFIGFFGDVLFTAFFFFSFAPRIIMSSTISCTVYIIIFYLDSHTGLANIVPSSIGFKPLSHILRITTE